MLEEAKKRDHRKLGKELELFTFSEKVGMGLPLWLPKGTMLREKLQQFVSYREDILLEIYYSQFGWQKKNTVSFGFVADKL